MPKKYNLALSVVTADELNFGGKTNTPQSGDDLSSGKNRDISSNGCHRIKKLLLEVESECDSDSSSCDSSGED